MVSFVSLLGASRRTITVRLNQLQETLQTLGVRLRASVLQIISENLSTLVRETFRESLGVTAPYDYRPRWQAHDDDHWQETDDWRDEENPYDDDAAAVEPCSDAPDNRSTAALACGLRAMAWGLRRWSGRGAVWGATGWGIAVACAAYFTGTLAAAGLTLLETADQLATFGSYPLR